jgi:hypothetical protein
MVVSEGVQLPNVTPSEEQESQMDASTPPDDDFESREDDLELPETMTDTEFAEAVDARLWISSSGELRNNVENYKAVHWSLEELDQAVALLHDLVETLVSLKTWRQHPQLAIHVLEALLFTEEQSGQRHGSMGIGERP